MSRSNLGCDAATALTTSASSTAGIPSSTEDASSASSLTSVSSTRSFWRKKQKRRQSSIKSEDRLTRLSVANQAPSYNYVTARPSGNLNALGNIPKDGSFRHIFGLSSSIIAIPPRVATSAAAQGPSCETPLGDKLVAADGSTLPTFVDDDKSFDPRFPPRRVEMKPVNIKKTPVHVRCEVCGIKAFSKTRLDSCTAANVAIGVFVCGVGWLVMLPCWLNCFSRTEHECPECGCSYGGYTPLC
jgi:LITAF-like zinc ribbon domain